MSTGAAANPDHDEKLMMFLGMTEDRVDTEVAKSLLESHNWDVQRAIASLFDDPGAPGAAVAAAGAPAAAPGGFGNTPPAVPTGKNFEILLEHFYESRLTPVSRLQYSAFVTNNVPSDIT